MLRTMYPLLVVGLLSAAAPVRVDDAYTIKVKRSDKGAVTTQDKQESEDSKLRIEDPDGKVLQEKKDKKNTTLIYKETILEKVKGKKAVKLRREYTKAVVKTEEGDKTIEQVLSYQGKTLLIEKKDGKYHFTIEGGAELTDEEAKELNKSFNKDRPDDSDDEEFEKALFPKKPVKVNESWKLDTEAIVKSFQKAEKDPLPVDKTKVTGTGKLLRAYKKDGKQFGVLDIRIELPLKGDFPLGKGAKAPIEAGAKMTMHMEIDTCIDGSSSDGVADMSMDIDMKAVIKGPDGRDYKMSLTGKNREKTTEKDLAKK